MSASATESSMRKSGLINCALIAGLAVGPCVGALAYTLLAMAAHGGQISLMSTLITTVGIGYVLTLPVFLPVMLALRHWRSDSLIACILIGFAIGLVVFYAATGVFGSGWVPLVFQGGLPFALMLGAVRLIASRRV